MNIKTLVRIGAVASALVAIGGFVAFAAKPVRGILDSGPLPVPSRVELAQLAGQLQSLQKNNQELQTHQVQIDKSLDITTLGQLTLQLMLAEHEAGPHPVLSEQQFIQSIKDEINPIRKRLGLPPIR